MLLLLCDDHSFGKTIYKLRKNQPKIINPRSQSRLFDDSKRIFIGMLNASNMKNSGEEQEVKSRLSPCGHDPMSLRQWQLETFIAYSRKQGLSHG